MADQARSRQHGEGRRGTLKDEREVGGFVAAGTGTQGSWGEKWCIGLDHQTIERNEANDLRQVPASSLIAHPPRDP